jgi:hypothetical protein
MTKEPGAEANQYKIAHSPCMDLVAHENSSIVCMIDANFGGETRILYHIARKLARAPLCSESIITMAFQEEIMTRNPVFADVITKMAYFSLIVAALVFVSMLLLTRLHP